MQQMIFVNFSPYKWPLEPFISDEIVRYQNIYIKTNNIKYLQFYMPHPKLDKNGKQSDRPNLLP